MERKILQVIPAAPGWRCAYATSDWELYFEDLPCWALVEHQDGSRGVVPLMPTEETELGFDDGEGFLSVVGPSAHPERLKFLEDRAAARAKK